MKNTFVKVLSFVMALMMVVGTFGTLAVFAETCAHDDRKVVDTVKATCGDMGYTKYHCNDCGKEFIDDIVAPYGDHDIVKVPAVEATCKPGRTEGEKCTRCDKYDTTKEVAGDPTKHIFNVVYTQEATCEKEGFTGKKCYVCGELDMASIDPESVVPAGHKYQYEVIDEWTACTTGKVHVTCSACDYDDYIEQEGKHTWVDMKAYTKTGDDYVDVPAELRAGDTCQYNYVSGKYCSVCKTPSADAVKNNKEGHDYKKVNFNKVTNDNLTQAIMDAGFKVDDLTSKDATCTETGYYLGKCTCGAYKKVITYMEDGTDDNGDTAHDWGEWSDEYIKDKTLGSGETVKDDKYHAFDKLHKRTCKDCGAEEKDKVSTGKTAHEYKKETAVKVTTPAGCITGNGLKTYTCDLCGDSSKTEVIFPAGEHTYGEWKYVDGYSCTGDQTKKMYAVCTSESCEVSDKGIKYQDAKNSDHTPVRKEVVGTCMTEANYYFDCGVCGYLYPETGDGAKDENNTNGKDAAKHVVYILKDINAADDAIVKDKILEYPASTLIDKGYQLVNADHQAQSCVNDELDRYLCACGELVDVVVKKATGHTVKFDDKGELVADTFSLTGKKDGKNVDLNAVPSTCLKEGKTAGAACKTCGYIVVEQKSVPVNSENHVDANGNVVPGEMIKEDDAYCAQKAYTTKYYYCCGEVDTIYYNEAGSDKDGFNPARHDYKKHDEVPATCLKEGTKEYYTCNYCSKLFDADKKEISKVETIATPNKGEHKWVAEFDEERLTKYAEKLETCDTVGYKAYKVCEECDAFLVGNQIVEDKSDTKADERIEAIKIAPHGDKYTDVWVSLNSTKDPNCTEGVWKNIPGTKICKQCVLDADQAKAEKSHENGTYWKVATGCKWELVEHVNNPAWHNDSKTPDYDCTLPSYDMYACKTCGKTEMRNFAAAADGDKGHASAKGEDGKDVAFQTIAATCETAGKVIYKCEKCDHKWEKAGDAQKKHEAKTASGATIEISFACNEFAPFAGLQCINGCGNTVPASIKADNEKAREDRVLVHVVVDAEVPATCTTAGYYAEYCANCKDYDPINETVYTKPLEHDYVIAKKADATIDKDGFEEYTCTRCGDSYTKVITKVVTSIVADAESVNAGSTIKVTVKVASGNYEFNNMKLNIAYNANLFEIVDLENDIQPMDGVKHYASVNSDGLGITLVVPYNEKGEEQTVAATAEGIDVVTITFTAKKFASGDANFDVAKRNDADVDCEPVKVKVVGLGNVNGDTLEGKPVITGEDAVALTKWFYVEDETDESLDFNKNGIIELGDLALLGTFAASNQTAKDYLILLGAYSEITAIIDAMEFDLNGDAVVNANDRYILTKRVDAALSVNFTLIDFASIEELVNGVIDSIIDPKPETKA